jgi:D-beta-D-heptose 7-phosphate kinase/D-beta-D-heptose 1-phosphate adenosyltransferase
MSNNRVLVVGEICDDIFIYGSASRLCPDVPAPVFKANKEVRNKGMAGNTIRNLESLGHKVDSITQINFITKTRYVDEKLNYTFLRVDEGEDNVDTFQEYGANLITDEEISEFDAIVISDYNKGFLSEEDISRFCSNNTNTFLDTKKCIGPWCKDVAYIKINNPEFEAIKSKIDCADWVDKLIVTLGDRGCMMMKEKGFSYYPAEKVPVFDLSGAGDSFLAALVAKQLETNNIDKAIEYANNKASEIVQQRGVSVISK